MIPLFDIHRVLVEPWTDYFSGTFSMVLMGFLVSVACGLVGNYLLLRRMALVGDAISHSILPGLVVAFLIAKKASLVAMMSGAMVAGLITVVLIEFIHRQSRVKPDAAICIAFTTLFSIGVVMVSMLETKGSFHIDPECVLYGDITYVSQEPPIVWHGITLGPPPVVRMASVVVAVVVAILVFYKELLVTSFDPGLAKSLGLRTGLWHYGLMAVLAMVVVGAFEAVGAVLAVAMLIVPPMFAAQLSNKLPARLILTVVHSLVSSLLGFHLSTWLNCSVAGALVVAGALLFVGAWIGTAVYQRIPHRVAAPDGTEEVESPA